MPATNSLTEQAHCPRHNCPGDTHPYHWYDIRYCFPHGSKTCWEREEYWSKVRRPEGAWWYNCPKCWMLDSYVDDQWMMARKHIDDYAKRIAKSQRGANGKHKGAWTLCLNYSPKWYDNDYEAQVALRTAVDRLVRYYKEQLEVFRAVGEFTKAGASHVHIFYRLDSGGKITDKNLKRAYPWWDAKVKCGTGNQGGQHAPVKDVADYSGYIEKDLDVSWFQLTYPEDAVSQVQVQVPSLPEAEVNLPTSPSDGSP